MYLGVKYLDFLDLFDIKQYAEGTMIMLHCLKKLPVRNKHLKRLKIRFLLQNHQKVTKFFKK